jgi:hypothetical protein
MIYCVRSASIPESPDGTPYHDENQRFSEIDAYVLLMSKSPILKPLAGIIGLPLVRPVLSKVYHWKVNLRLRRSGRL